MTRDLGKERIGHLDRQKLIDYGRTELRAVIGPDYGRYLNSQAVSPLAH